MASLFVIQGNDQGRRFDLQGKITTLGRDAANPIRLRDNEVSRKHAELRPVDPDVFRLIDLGSANGTYVNGQPISETTLRGGDRLQLGQSVLLFSLGPASPSDLTERVDLLARANPQDRSAIIRSIAFEPGAPLHHSTEATSDWLKARIAHLSVLYQATQAISFVLDLDELLPQILQLVFESIGADRGAILLDDGAGTLIPKAVRWRSQAEPGERLTLSQTIVDHVRETGEAVVTTDAPADARFLASHSISEFAIREAICVPLRGRHTTLGVLYADAQGDIASLGPTGKLTNSRFTQEQLMLMIAIGNQAGLAIENTEFHGAIIESERMAAIGQTITILSHHIKNILQGLRGGSYLIDQGLKDKDDNTVRKGWSVVEKNQNKIYNMVLDMLSFCKEREPSLESANLNQTVADAVELLQPRAVEYGVAFTWSPDPAVPSLLFDPEALHRAVLNILGNAFDALTGAQNPWVKVRTRWDASASTAHIEISDNGRGIATEEISNVFRPFASTKGSRGTGLGLPVSEKILREHGGAIKVTSEVGKGTIFDLELPQNQQKDALATLG